MIKLACKLDLSPSVYLSIYLHISVYLALVVSIFARSISLFHLQHIPSHWLLRVSLTLVHMFLGSGGGGVCVKGHV